MGYLILGRGVLDVDPATTRDDMEFVAIPAGTTIRFYADTGQGLDLAAGEVDLWEQLERPWPLLDATRVTYNLCLFSAPGLSEVDPCCHPEFAPHTLVRAAAGGMPNPLRMCSGTRETCPTRPGQVASGARHDCTGILGVCSGDLYWVACHHFRHTESAAGSRDLPH